MKHSDAGIQCQSLWKSDRDFFFFWLCIEREDEHLEIVQVVTQHRCQKALSAGCMFFQQWPHTPGTPQKIWSRVTHMLCLKPEVAEWSAWWWEWKGIGWHIIVSFGKLLVDLLPYIEEATRNTSRRWYNIWSGGARGICYGRKYQSRYYATPVYYWYTNIITLKATFMHQQLHQGWSTCFDVFSRKNFWR